MQGEDGTYYRSLIFLSYVSKGGLIDAKTIGIGGVVFGPVITQPMKCPKDYVVLPSPSSFKHEFHVTMRSDGTLLVDGKEISQAALLKQLGELPEKGETQLTLHASMKVRSVEVTQLEERIRSLGFQAAMLTIYEADASGNKRP